jgi:hypothetical protein
MSSRKKQAGLIFYQQVADGNVGVKLIHSFFQDIPEFTAYFKAELKDFSYGMLIHSRFVIIHVKKYS